MFTDRPYDGFSIVSTSLKCKLQVSVQFWKVLSLAVSQHGVCLVCTPSYSPFPSLPGYLHLRFMLGDCQLFQAVVIWLSSTRTQQAALIVFVYFMYEVYT